MTMPPPPAFGAGVPPAFSQPLPMYNALPSYTAAAPPPAFAAALSAPTLMHGLQAYDTTADGRADSVDTTGDGLADSVVLPRTASIEAILAERRRASAGPLSPHTRPFPAPQITQPPPPLPALQVCVGLPAVAAPPEAEGRLAAVVADSPDHAVMVAVQNHSATEWLTLRAGSVEPHRSQWLLAPPSGVAPLTTAKFAVAGASATVAFAGGCSEYVFCYERAPGGARPRR